MKEKEEIPEQEQPIIEDDDSPLFEGTVEEELEQFYDELMSRARKFGRRTMKGGKISKEEEESQVALWKQYNQMLKAYSSMLRLKGKKAGETGFADERIVDKVKGMKSSMGDIVQRVPTQLKKAQ